MRTDLRISQQTHQGLRQWVLKDPLSLKYHRLGAQQFAVLELLDGNRSLADIKDSLNKKFPQLAFTYSQLQSLVMQLHRSGVAASETTGQGEQLLARHRKHQRQQLLARIFSVFAIRLPGIDPEPFLRPLYRYVRWIYHPVSVFACMMMILGALVMVLIDFDYFLVKLPAFKEFFSGGNIIPMMLALAVAKVVHETGHGLTCKHFGGECREMGALLLVFTPCLYCDTSDSWMVASRWRRAAIGAAGMYFELILAALCTFVWFSTQPGLLNFLCLNTIFVCSISTLIFNCNPLLRYDGYYILSDLMEVPNLSRRAQTALVQILRSVCLGLPIPKESSFPERLRALFAAYAVASTAYRTFIIVLILWFVSEMFEPYGLRPIGDILIGVFLTGMIAVPAIKLFRYFTVPGRITQVKRARVASTCVASATILLLIVCVPLPHYIYASVSVQPRDAHRVYVEVEGTLNEIFVRPGDTVHVNQPIATLDNPTLDYESEKLSGQKRQQETKLVNLRRQQVDDVTVSQEIPHTIASISSLAEREGQLRGRQENLIIRTPVAGQIFSAAPLPEQEGASGQLHSWSGSPLQPENIGSHLHAGTLMCLIGDPSRFEAIAIIDQSDADLVTTGGQATIVLDELPTVTMHCEVIEVAALDTQVAPRELSTKSGGSLNTTTDLAGMEKPLNVSYQARIALPTSQPLLSGYRGTAKIYVGIKTLGGRLLDFVYRQFRRS